MQAATDFLRGVGSRMRDDEMLDLLLQKVDGILAQQAKPPPALLGTHPVSYTVPTQVTIQNGPQPAQTRDPAHKPKEANSRPSSAGAAHTIPEAELLSPSYIFPGIDDFGYDSLYSAMAIIGDEWSRGMPDGLGTW